ncbi:MAG TPA: PHP domain-containing protein, partial [Kaistella sp.]|nr:PHP domain-containing protein [Kaistella sp.]
MKSSFIIYQPSFINHQPSTINHQSSIMFLNCHTFHSLRYGTLSVEELVKQASECGVSELALTDINTVTAIY